MELLEKLKKIRKVFTTINLIILIVWGLVWALFCFIFMTTIPFKAVIKFNLLRNKDVADVEILKKEMWQEHSERIIEIQTKDGYKIFLHNVGWTLKSDDYKIDGINDIGCFGGNIYEITEEGQASYNPKSSKILEKMIGKKLDSVDDIIDSRKELYELYKLFEPKSRLNWSEPRTEFIYKDRFIIKADYAKEGSYIFEKSS